MAYTTTNPATGETLARFDQLTDDQIDALIAGAHRAFLTWRDVPVAGRAAVVSRAGALMRERGDELARLLTLEMGKLIGEAKGEVKLAAAILRYYGEHGPGFLADEPLDTPAGTARIVHQPLGVLLGVEPWNFPLYQVVRFAAPNLVIGNTVLVKHASICPQSALALEKLFRDAGAPEGVYTNLFASTGQIERVIDHELVRGASLTGSDAAGKSVGEIAGRNAKKVVLELGGSDPFIVLDLANAERTIKAAVMGRMANTGQSCVAAKRFIVLADVYDAFVGGLRDAMAALRPGDPMDPATTAGPLSSDQAATGLLELVDDAVQKGATLVLGGRRVDRPGAFVEPTILTGVTPEMRAFQEELFGPVAVVYRVADDDEAVALANASQYGLGGAVFSSDLARAERLAQRIESGMVWINHPTASLPQLPFGGVKNSGFGRELSRLGMTEFVNQKLIYALPPDAKLMGAGG